MTAGSTRRPRFQPEPGRFVLTDERGVDLCLTRVRRERHELFGELSVHCAVAGVTTVNNGVLSVGTFNVSSPRARRDRATELASRARVRGFDWAALLEEFCQLVLDADRAGEPATLLRDTPRPKAAESFDVEGLQLFRQHPAIWFGDGGTAKSYLALYVAGQLARKGLTVLLADWELSGEDHRERLERIFGTDMPPVLYARCDRPMSVTADRLARIVRDNGVEFLVCDSISFACDGPPEAAEVASRYFQALRQIGIGSLSLAHTNRSERADEKPFGSTFWHNGARSTWHVKLASSTQDGLSLTVGLFNKKANLGPLRPAVGFSIAFDAERTHFRRVNVASVEELAEALPLWQRIKHAVRHQPQTLAALAGELGANIESLDRTVRRKRELFTRVTGDDGVTRIALVERQVA